jgi:hypothetical protein
MAEALGTVRTRGSGLLRGWWWPVGLKLHFGHMVAPVQEIMDGSFSNYVRLNSFHAHSVLLCEVSGNARTHARLTTCDLAWLCSTNEGCLVPVLLISCHPVCFPETSGVEVGDVYSVAAPAYWRLTSACLLSYPFWWASRRQYLSLPFHPAEHLNVLKTDGRNSVNVRNGTGPRA